MLFYTIYRGRGRSILFDDLCETERGEDDPFSLNPRVIVERVFALGMTPVVDWPNSEPWHAPGATYRVEKPEGIYLVTIGRDAEQILVQEERDSSVPYPLTE